MLTLINQAARRRNEGRPAGFFAGAAVLAAGSVSAAVVLSAAPAYADVTSSNYTIGAPSGAVSNAVASPSAVTKGEAAGFQVAFTVGGALSGGGNDWVSVSVNGATLGSTPTNVALVGSSCVQTGTAGSGGAGTAGTTTLTIELNSSCSLAAGSRAEVDFDATAPSSSGSFSFSVTTSADVTAATTNSVTLSNFGPALTAGLYAPGANTTYTVTGATVANLTTSGSSLKLTSAATTGTETIAFLNSPGGSGYSVTVTPPNGAATSDAVTSAASSGSSVTLTLASALTEGEALNVTATGTNPAPNGSAQANDITVTPGNGTAEVTNSVLFGNSVSGVSVSPGSTVAGATTTYTVNFQATSAVGSTGTITVAEPAGPPDFSSVTGVEVIDNTQNWHFVASSPTLSRGTAVITMQSPYVINAHDSITVLLASATNPASAGSVSDFTVATSGDPVPASAAAYTIGVNASPGVVVTVNPTATNATATYTISNIHASAQLAGGTSTLKVEAPAGTVFPNNPVFYSIADSTTSSGSGTVSAALTGGATNSVTLVVPNTINTGDVFTLDIGDVVNPATPSSTDSVSLIGNVVGPAPQGTTTTTTTTMPPTTTTPIRPSRPSVGELTSSAGVASGVVYLKFRCYAAACQGAVTLTDVTTRIGGANYHAGAGQTFTVHLGVNSKGISYLRGAKDHTIKVWDAVTVKGGATAKGRLTLVMSLRPSVAELSGYARVANGVAYLGFRCTAGPCQGSVALTDVTTKIAGANYHAGTGQTFSVHLGVNSKGMSYLRGAKDHTIKVWDTVTVKGGATARGRLTLGF